MVRNTILAMLCLIFTNSIYGSTIPFRVVGKSIIIKGRVNHRSGYFILDTGAAKTVISSEYFAGMPTGKKMLGFDGKETRVQKSRVRLYLNDSLNTWLEVRVLSLAHFEQCKGISIMGLVGMDFLRDYQLTIDFDALTLDLIPLRKQQAEVSWDNTPEIITNIRWIQGVPAINATIGSTSFCFILDSGAGINLFDLKKAKSLEVHFTFDKAGEILGLGQKAQSVKRGYIHNLFIEKFHCPKMRIALTNVKEKTTDKSSLPFDGVLGYELLKYFKTSFNFKEGTMMMWRRDNFGQQLEVRNN